MLEIGDLAALINCPTNRCKLAAILRSSFEDLLEYSYCAILFILT
jgi:hypothetical protein